MKIKTIQSLVFILTFCSCLNNDKIKTAEGDKQTISNNLNIHPNDLFLKNCAMCHGYNKDMTAPAINSYSIDSIIKFFDGKTRNDSIWKKHSEIKLTRTDWERIATQMQPFDIFPK